MSSVETRNVRAVESLEIPIDAGTLAGMEGMPKASSRVSQWNSDKTLFARDFQDIASDLKKISDPDPEGRRQAPEARRYFGILWQHAAQYLQHLQTFDNDLQVYLNLETESGIPSDIFSEAIASLRIVAESSHKQAKLHSWRKIRILAESLAIKYGADKEPESSEKDAVPDSKPSGREERNDDDWTPGYRRSDWQEHLKLSSEKWNRFRAVAIAGGNAKVCKKYPDRGPIAFRRSFLKLHGRTEPENKTSEPLF